MKEFDDMESALKELDWNSYFIKDFVKSLNTDGQVSGLKEWRVDSFTKGFCSALSK